MIIWPAVSDKASARKAVEQGVFACATIAAIDLSVALYASLNHGTLAGYGALIWIDGVLFALIGWRLWKNSRIASLIGLVLMAIEIADKLRHHPKTFNILTTILLLAILNSVRGAFAIHTLSQNEQIFSGASTRLTAD